MGRLIISSVATLMSFNRQPIPAQNNAVSTNISCGYLRYYLRYYNSDDVTLAGLNIQMETAFWQQGLNAITKRGL
jgi:hypothetical protein